MSFYEIDDLWKILNTIRGGTEDIPKSLSTLGLSEQKKTISLFSDIIDQQCFQTQDYLRIRNFIIDLYSSHKTLTSAQKNVHDIYSLDEQHLDELFKSFGFNFSRQLSIFTKETNINKANFFLDLVNLYKIKGTPQGLAKVLAYYGFADLDIIEFWLQKNSEGDLIFRGEVIEGTISRDLKLPIIDLDFNTFTENDPHWLLPESKIHQLFSLNQIRFPSKSPYFSLRPKFDLTTINAIMSAVVRIVQDQYYAWNLNGTIPTKDVEVTKTGDKVSLLEIYLANIYLFNSEYEHGKDNNINFLCYDGTTESYAQIISEFTNLIKMPSSRSEKKINTDLFSNLFTRLKSTNFLINKNTAGTILNQINSTFKQNVDNLLIDTFNFEELLINFLIDLSRWIRVNFGLGYPSLAFIVLGREAILNYVGDVIDFFKPYHARVSLVEAINVSNDPLHDSLIMEDGLFETITENIYDYQTGNSTPCCSSPNILCPGGSYYSRDFYDCGSYHDLGHCLDEFAIYDDGVLVYQSF